MKNHWSGFLKLSILYLAEFFRGMLFKWKGTNKKSHQKMRFHSEFGFVIGSIEGHMTFFLRFLEIWKFFQENNLVFLFLKFFIIVEMPLGNPVCQQCSLAIGQWASVNGKSGVCFGGGGGGNYTLRAVITLWSLVTIFFVGDSSQQADD